MTEKKGKIYTLDDIAKNLGVSKTTVSRSISGKGRIGKETRERVLQFIKDHEYTPNIMAKGLAQQKTFNIALAMPADLAISDLPFFQKCTNGICQIAAENDYDVILFRTNGTDLSQLKRILNNKKADGIILMRTLVHDRFIHLLRQKSIPFVAIGSSEDEDVTHVDNDHSGLCKTLTEFLLSKGLQRFVLIGGCMEYYVNKSRLKGFLEAINEQTKKISHIDFLDVTKEQQIVKAVDDALEFRADCIICMDDYICLRVITRLAELSVKIPEDISVVTFYTNMLLENINPIITGLEFDDYKLGEVACQVLINKFNGEHVEDYISTDCRLIIGKSTI